MERFVWILLLYVALVGTTKNAFGDLNDTILNIFRIGPEPGLHIFNSARDATSFNTTTKSTFNSHIVANNRNSNHNPNEKSNQKQHSKQSHIRNEPFKVQRAPDGKLNLVFNTFSYLQPIATQSPNTQGNKVNPDFVFPGELDNTPKCSDSNSPYFCTNVINYPDKKIFDDLLVDRTTYSIFFGEIVLQPTNISQRMDGIEDEYLCRTQRTVTYPESAITRDSEVLIVVNKYPEYKQAVIVEKCLDAGKSCTFEFPNGYTSQCKQETTLIPLLAIRNHTLVKEQFEMPSCCKCTFTHH